jgi:hypothetical protein
MSGNMQNKTLPQVKQGRGKYVSLMLRIMVSRTPGVSQDITPSILYDSGLVTGSVSLRNAQGSMY